MLKVFIHIHNVTLLFNLSLVNCLYLGITLLSHIQQITIHFLWPLTHNFIPGSFYFELTTLGKGLSLTCKADCPPLSMPTPDLSTSALLWLCKTILPPKISLPWGVDRYQHFHVFSIFYKYRMSQEEWTKLRESVPYVKLYRYNPKHLYPKLNGYGDNGHRNMWASWVSTYCTPSVTPCSYNGHARQRDTAS